MIDSLPEGFRFVDDPVKVWTALPIDAPETAAHDDVRPASPRRSVSRSPVGALRTV